MTEKKEGLPLRVSFIKWVARKLGFYVGVQVLPKVFEKPGFAKYIVWREYYGKHRPIYRLEPSGTPPRNKGLTIQGGIAT